MAVPDLASLIERATEHLKHAIAQLDPFLEHTRSSSLVGDLENDVHCTLLLGCPKYVTHSVDLSFGQPLLRAVGEFDPQSHLAAARLLLPIRLLCPAIRASNRLTNRSNHAGQTDATVNTALIPLTTSSSLMSVSIT
jgi:hypothetical protein